VMGRAKRMMATVSHQEAPPGTAMAATRATEVAREMGRKASGTATGLARPILPIERLAVAAVAQAMRAASALPASMRTAPPWTRRLQLHVLPLHPGHHDLSSKQHLQPLRTSRGREIRVRMRNPYTPTRLATTNVARKPSRAEPLSTRSRATRLQHLHRHLQPVDRPVDRALQGAGRRLDTSAIGASPASTGSKIALCLLEGA
jgi:hypothetical protein